MRAAVQAIWRDTMQQLTYNRHVYSRQPARLQVLQRGPMAELLVPISPGELIDKITILEIKSERMTDATKLHNVRTELALLSDTWRASAYSATDIEEEWRGLRGVNARAVGHRRPHPRQGAGGGIRRRIHPARTRRLRDERRTRRHQEAHQREAGIAARRREELQGIQAGASGRSRADVPIYAACIRRCNKGIGLPVFSIGRKTRGCEFQRCMPGIGQHNGRSAGVTSYRCWAFGWMSFSLRSAVTGAPRQDRVKCGRALSRSAAAASARRDGVRCRPQVRRRPRCASRHQFIELAGDVGHRR